MATDNKKIGLQKGHQSTWEVKGFSTDTNMTQNSCETIFSDKIECPFKDGPPIGAIISQGKTCLCKNGFPKDKKCE